MSKRNRKICFHNRSGCGSIEPTSDSIPANTERFAASRPENGRTGTFDMKLIQLTETLRSAPTAPVFVVGAGVTGCVFAERIASLFRRTVVLLEKRAEIGGNSRADIDPETGVERHLYGSHIFHTTNRGVWDYVRRFSDFTPYRHRVFLMVGGRVYSMPIDLKTINDFYGTQFSPAEARAFLTEKIREEGVSAPRNLEEKAVSLVGRGLYECMIRGYTAKQWGRDPSELPESIINRLPVRYRYDDAYFSTPWQGIPAKGYAELFSNLVRSPLVEVRTGVDFFAERKSFPRNAVVIYTGMIDRLFDNRFGTLEWRSLRFEWENVPVQDYQGTSVVNYGDPDVPFTRIHEFKHYHPEWKESWALGKTVICREYPAVWAPGGDAYYPLGDEKNRTLLSRYMAEAEKTPNLFVAGRLGSYQYLDMDGAMAQALACFA